MERWSAGNRKAGKGQGQDAGLGQVVRLSETNRTGKEKEKAYLYRKIAGLRRRIIMKKRFALLLLLSVILHTVSHGDVPYEEHISYKTYNLFSSPVPIADLIKTKNNIQAATVTVPEVKTSSLELVPMGNKASVTFVFPKRNLFKRT